jgi:hypothetical protein
MAIRAEYERGVEERSHLPRVRERKRWESAPDSKGFYGTLNNKRYGVSTDQEDSREGV